MVTLRACLILATAGQDVRVETTNNNSSSSPDLVDITSGGAAIAMRVILKNRRIKITIEEAEEGLQLQPQVLVMVTTTLETRDRLLI